MLRPATCRRCRWLVLAALLFVLLALLPPPPLVLGPPGVPLSPPSRLLPLGYWLHRRTHRELYSNGTCATFPDMETLVGGRHMKGVWQRVRLRASSSPRARVLVVSARWDTRALPLPPTVRVLLYSDVTPVPALFCQLWYYGESTPEVVRVELTYSWSEAEGPVSGAPEPYVAACAPPRGLARGGPAALCLVERRCDTASVALRVQEAPLPPDMSLLYEPEPPAPVGARVGAGAVGVGEGVGVPRVGVCARWVHGARDVSGRLVEWLQLLKRFGVNTVHVYISGPLHDNVQAVLRHCGAAALCHVTVLSPPPTAPPAPPHHQPPRGHMARYSQVALNDCLYSSLTRHDWLLPLQLDQMLLPLQHGTFPRLVAEASRGDDDALLVRGRWFPPAAQPAPRPPRTPAFLDHLWRAHNYTHRDWFSAAFLRTSTVLTMHTHSPAHCLARTGAPRACRSRRLAPTRAIAHDYRAGCPLRLRHCLAARSRPVKDAAMLRWSDVDKDVRGILKLLNISDEHSIL